MSISWDKVNQCLRCLALLPYLVINSLPNEYDPISQQVCKHISCILQHAYGQNEQRTSALATVVWARPDRPLLLES